MRQEGIEPYYTVSIEQTALRGWVKLTPPHAHESHLDWKA